MVGELGDVAEAFFARQGFDEGAEFHQAGDAAGVDLTDFDFAHDVLDHLLGFLHALGIVGGDEDVAVFVDVDVDAGLVDDLLDDFAAGADDVADLVDLDLDGLDARCVRGEISGRLVDALEHLAEDEGAAALGLLQGGGQDLAGEAVDLDVHLDGGDAFGRAGDLEVHVAEGVFHALDIREDRVLIPFFDETHSDAGDGALDGHAGVHQREGAAADGAHGARAVGLEDLGDEADRVRELLDGRDDRHEGALGKGAVADLAAARAAHRAGFADAVAREVVMMDVVLRRLGSEAVDDLLVAEGAERRDREDLGLATREEARAVRARQQADFTRYRADFFDFAAVRTDLLMRDHVAHDGLLEVVDGDSDLFVHLRVELEEVFHGVGRDLGDVGVAVELVRVAHGGVEAVLGVVADGLLHLVRDEEELRLALLLAAVGLDALLELDEALDLLVAEQDGVEDDVFRQLVGAGLDHHDGIVGAGDGEVQRRDFALLFGRVDDELIVDAADAHARNRSHERDVGDSQGARCADHGGELRRVVLLDGEDGRDNLNVVAEAFREQRADWAVDQARAEDGVARRASLTLDEASRDLACCIHLLFVVDRQWEEVDAFARLSRGRGRHEHDGIAIAHEDGAVGLLRELSVLDDERAACEFHLKAIHMYLLGS